MVLVLNIINSGLYGIAAYVDDADEYAVIVTKNQSDNQAMEVS